MEAVLGEIGDRPCVLDAQSHLADFYRRLGFGDHAKDVLYASADR